MPRPKSITPSANVRLYLPKDLMTRVDLLLFSTVENRVPYGAYTRFFSTLLRDRFDSRTLDLGKYHPDLAGLTVSGSGLAVHSLINLLERELP